MRNKLSIENISEFQLNSDVEVSSDKRAISDISHSDFYASADEGILEFV